jgi:hypothetical protein
MSSTLALLNYVAGFFYLILRLYTLFAFILFSHVLPILGYKIFIIFFHVVKAVHSQVKSATGVIWYIFIYILSLFTFKVSIPT